MHIYTKHRRCKLGHLYEASKKHSTAKKYECLHYTYVLVNIELNMKYRKTYNQRTELLFRYGRKLYDENHTDCYGWIM